MADISNKELEARSNIIDAGSSRETANVGFSVLNKVQRTMLLFDLPALC